MGGSREAIALLGALNAALDVMVASAKSISENHKEKKDIKAFVSAIRENSGEERITAENTALYATNEFNAEKTVEMLHKNNIPAVALTNDKDTTRIIAVPAQFAREADRIVSIVNDTPSRTEVSRSEFMKENLGKDMVQFTDLSKAEVELVRDKMVDKDIEYCVEKNRDGSYTISTLQENNPEMGAAVFISMSETRDALAERNMERIEQKSAVSHDVLANRHLEKRDVYFGDADKDNELYRVSNGKLERITDGKSEIIAEKHDPDFDAKIHAEIQKMKYPLSVVLEKEAKNVDKERLKNIEGLASKEEVVRAKKNLAVEESSLGHVEQAQILASQIAALSINNGTPVENKEAVTTLNSTISFSEYCARDSKTVAEQELKEQYKALKLTEEEDRAVSDHVKDVNDRYQENDHPLIKIGVTYLAIDGIRDFFEKTDIGPDIDSDLGHNEHGMEDLSKV